MADHIWISTGSTDYDVASNWSTGVVPFGASAIIFRGSRSKVSCLQHVDRSGDFQYTRVVTEPDYPGQIGDPSNPLIIAVDNVSDPKNRIIHRGTGTMYLNPEVGFGGHDVVVDSQNHSLAAWVTGNPRNLCVKSGRVVAKNATLSGYAIVNGGTANVEFDGSSFGSGLALFSGAASSNVGIGSTTPTVIAGALTMTGKLLADAPVVILSTGTLIYKPTLEPAAGDVPNIIINGILDLRESAFNLAAKFGRIVIGRTGQILGLPFGGLTPTKSYIDLRQEYP